MELIKGYPDHIVFKTKLGGNVDISCGNGYIKVIYLYEGKPEQYVIKETKQYKLVMNK